MTEVKTVTVRRYLGTFDSAKYDVIVPLDEITGIAATPVGQAIILRRNGLYYLLEGWTYTELWERLRDGHGFPPSDVRETA